MTQIFSHLKWNAFIPSHDEEKRLKQNDPYLNFVRQPGGTAGPEAGRKKSGGAASGSSKDPSKLSALCRREQAAVASGVVTPPESKLSVESNDASTVA